MKSFIKLSAVALLAVSCLSYTGCSEAMDAAKDAGGGMVDAAKDAGDKAKEAGSDMKDKVMGAGGEATEAGGEMMDKAAEGSEAK